MHAQHISTGPENINRNDTLISESEGVRVSTENLMSKPAQRKLDYDEPEESCTGLKNDIQSASPDERQEHLHSYLRKLSEMPSGSTTAETLDVSSKNIATKSFGHIPVQITPNGSPYNSNTNNYSGSKSSNSSESDMNIQIEGAAAHTSPEEEALHLQLVYFEQLKQKLMEQQEQQLASLVSQQQHQQMQLQQEFLTQEQGLFQELSVNSSLRQHSMLSNKMDSTLPKYECSIPQNNGSMVEPKLSKMLTEKTVQPCVKLQNNTSLIDSPELATHITQRHNRSKYKSGDTPNKQDKRTSPASVDPISVVRNANYPPFNYIQTGTMAASVLYQQPTLGRCQDVYSVSKVNAMARGYLVRRLWRTDRVQAIIQKIKDTATFALKFQQETPIKKGVYTLQDKKLQDSLIAQLTGAMYDFHDIFFAISIKERMAIISQDRILIHEKLFKMDNVQTKKVLSAATKKALERKKKALQAEATVFGGNKAVKRPKTAPPSTSSPKIPRSMDSGVIKRQYQQLIKKSFQPVQAKLSPIKPSKESLSVLTNEQRPKTAPGNMASTKRVIARLDRGKSPKRNTTKSKRLSVPGQTKTVRRSLYGNATTSASKKTVKPMEKPKEIVTSKK